MKSPRILFIAPVEPWCRENGSSLIIADLLDALTSRCGDELFAVFVRPPPPGYPKRPPAGFEGVLLDIPGLPRWASVLRSVVRWSSPLRHRFDNQLVAERIASVLAARNFLPDLVHVEHLPLVDIGLRLARGEGHPVVYRAHNVESRLWARRLRVPNVVRRPIVAHLERLEADAIRLVDLTLCISQDDLGWVRSVAPAAEAEVLPTTLKLERYDAVPRGRPAFEAQVCFVGGLDWAPNEDGLRWFVLEVLPRITRRVPRAGCAVLARGAAQRSWLRDNPAVWIAPPETDAPALFAASRVSVAPLFQAGGVRIKIPESLALGCPVVATRVGAEGHDLPGVAVTDDPAQFAEACIERLENPLSDDATHALHASVEEQYGARRHADRLIALWRETLAGRD